VNEPSKGSDDQGWARQQLQIPEDLRKILVAESKYRGQGSIKILGTLAIGVLLGMSQSARDKAYLAVTRASWGEAHDLTPEKVFEIFMQAIEETQRENPESGDHEPLFEVTRILDPELTPKPGEKQSDREQSSKRRKSG